MSTEIIVPWRAGCPHRERIWDWLSSRYAAEYPHLRVTLAPEPENRCEALRRGEAVPWVKALAFTPALQASDAEIVVMADADVWSDGLDEAIAAVRGGAEWATPHGEVLRLTEEATEAVLGGGDPEGQPLEQRPYPGVLGGGFVVARRETLLEVPMDPRFKGWGGEDESWGFALWHLLGPPKRLGRPLYHLWHPPQERITRRRGSTESWRLRKRYSAAARSGPDAFQALLEEANDALATDQ